MGNIKKREAEGGRVEGKDERRSRVQSATHLEWNLNDGISPNLQNGILKKIKI